jgi:hypothetical protein
MGQSDSTDQQAVHLNLALADEKDHTIWIQQTKFEIDKRIPFPWLFTERLDKVTGIPDAYNLDFPGKTLVFDKKENYELVTRAFEGLELLRKCKCKEKRI